MDLAAQESDRLSQTVSALEKFVREYEVYFHDLSELAQSHPLLVAIRNEFEELQSLKTSLELVEKRPSQFARNVSTI
jgi:Zn-finger domain-containing protein